MMQIKTGFIHPARLYYRSRFLPPQEWPALHSLLGGQGRMRLSAACKASALAPALPAQTIIGYSDRLQ